MSLRNSGRVNGACHIFFEAVLDLLTIGDHCSDFENRKTHEWKSAKMSAKAHRNDCVPERPTVNHGCQIPDREAQEIGKRTSGRARTCPAPRHIEVEVHCVPERPTLSHRRHIPDREAPESKK